jgi:hypothetical protein
LTEPLSVDESEQYWTAALMRTRQTGTMLAEYVVRPATMRRTASSRPSFEALPIGRNLSSAIAVGPEHAMNGNEHSNFRLGRTSKQLLLFRQAEDNKLSFRN